MKNNFYFSSFSLSEKSKKLRFLKRIFKGFKGISLKGILKKIFFIFLLSAFILLSFITDFSGYLGILSES